MLADRYPRKYLMIIANLFSFVILISFILTGILDNLFSVYALTILLVVGRAIYDPAGTAYLPTICNEEELLTANALISGGWSASMGIGAGLAGFVISEYGWETGLILDSVTFIIAAVVISTYLMGDLIPMRGKLEVFSRCSEKYFLVGNLLSKGQKSVELCWQRDVGDWRWRTDILTNFDGMNSTLERYPQVQLELVFFTWLEALEVDLVH